MTADQHFVNPRRLRHIVIIVVLLLPLLPPRAGAESPQIRFGTFDLPPYALHARGDGRRGMLRDFNAAVAKHAGLTHIDRIMPLKRIHKELVKGGVACSTFIPAAWSKRDLIQVAEITANVDSIVVPKKGLAVRRLQDLYGLTIAIPRGSYHGMDIMTDPKIKRVLTNGYNQSAAILRAGRVDAMVGSDIAVYHSLRAAGVAKVDIGRPFVFLKLPLWLQCRRDVDPGHIESLRRAARQLRAEGAFENIRAQYTSGYTE